MSKKWKVALKYTTYISRGTVFRYTDTEHHYLVIMIIMNIDRIIAGAHPHLQERQYSAIEQLLSVIDMVEVTINVTITDIIINNTIPIIIIIISIIMFNRFSLS